MFLSSFLGSTQQQVSETCSLFWFVDGTADHAKSYHKSPNNRRASDALSVDALEL